MRNEFPGLLASSFDSIGNYGIGFFSLFMLGESVQVKTRRASAAQAETLIMEFNTGLTSRPILRSARPDEQLIDGGTSVRVWLEKEPFEKGGLLEKRQDDESVYSLAELCKILCPSLDVDIEVEEDNTREVVIEASDWANVSGEELFSRIAKRNRSQMSFDDDEYESFVRKAAENLRLLKDVDDEVVGRACIAISHYFMAGDSTPALNGVVTVGGLKACPLSHIAGILKGEVARVSRDVGVPVVSTEALAEWATEQADLVTSLYRRPSSLALCAAIIRRCGGHTGDLPLVKRRRKWMSFNEIVEAEWDDEVLLLESYFTETAEEHNREINLNDNVLVGEFGIVYSILQGGPFMYDRYDNGGVRRWPAEDIKQWEGRSLGGAVCEALARSWDVDTEALVQSINPKDRSVEVIGSEDEQEVREKVYSVRKPS